MTAWARYQWSAIDQFRGRARELARLEQWWDDPTREPLALMGRRRVGKSWLCSRFAHDKPAVILVARERALGEQLRSFAAQLADLNGGVTPKIDSVGELIAVLYRLATDRRALAVIDEFPYLLGSTEARRRETLSAIQAVLERHRDASQLKLLLCGSQVGVMEALREERNPLHGRLQPMRLAPMTFADARLVLQTDDDVDAFTRFAIAGGMPRYLAALGGGTLAEAVASNLLDPHAALFNEGATIVAQELQTPAIYNSLLAALAAGAASSSDAGSHAGLNATTANKYLHTLAALHLVSSERPYGAPPTSRNQRWALTDPFLAFWLRFVEPFQEALQMGRDPAAHYAEEVQPALAGHVARVFEDRCRRHLLAAGGVSVAERWWGNALDEHRRTGERSSEEVDVVGARRGRVVLVGECKWTTQPLSGDIVDDLDRYKIPALARADGVKFAKDGPRLWLAARSGYSRTLRERAREDGRIELADLDDVLNGPA